MSRNRRSAEVRSNNIAYDVQPRCPWDNFQPCRTQEILQYCDDKRSMEEEEHSDSHRNLVPLCTNMIWLSVSISSGLNDVVVHKSRQTS